MALDFPPTPSINDTFSIDDKTWKWDGQKWLMVNVAPQITTSDIAPANPVAGWIWIDSTNGSQYVYMDSFWVEFGSDMGMTGANALSPVGIINPYAGANAPTNWMLCSGQAISRTVYASLYAAIGTAYGVGDGSTTFNLPDLRGRVIAGIDNMGGSDAGRVPWSNTLGTADGVHEVTLTGAQSGTSAHGHSNTLAVASANATHTHMHALAVSYYGNVASASTGWNGDNVALRIPTGESAYQENEGSMTSADAAHSHSLTGGVSNSSEAPASQAHTNMQPTMLMNYIIKVM